MNEEKQSINTHDWLFLLLIYLLLPMHRTHSTRGVKSEN